jgi:tetratricopeptide (TPR) repeat protein
MVYEDKGQLDEALRVFEEGIAKFPRETELLYRKGVVLDKMGKKEEALQVMKNILILDPESPEALNYVGYTYAEQGIMLDEAERYIKKALEKSPQDGYILDSMAWVYYKMGKYRKALEYIEKALKFVSDDPIISEHAGDIYRALGMKKKALELYQRAIDLGHDKSVEIENKIRELISNGEKH